MCQFEQSPTERKCRSKLLKIFTLKMILTITDRSFFLCKIKMVYLSLCLDSPSIIPLKQKIRTNSLYYFIKQKCNGCWFSMLNIFANIVYILIEIYTINNIIYTI